jgi:hypothetical protein
VIKDTAAPTDYDAYFVQDYVNSSNQTVIEFVMTGAEIGTFLEYDISDGSASETDLNIEITDVVQTIGPIDLTALADGTLTLTVTLTDEAGNEGTPVVADNITKDIVAPGAFTVAFTAAKVSTTAAFQFTGADTDTGTTADYTIDDGADSVGDSDISITAADQTVANIDVSSLADGTIALNVSLFDAAGNETAAAEVTTEKDAAAPANVTGVSATAGDTQVTLAWTDPGDGDFDHVNITIAGNPTPVEVAAGVGTETITGLTNGTEYSFTITSVDDVGNESAGVTILSTPSAP